MVVGDEGAFGGCVDEPVVPDRGGEGEESRGDAGVDAGDGSAAVFFEGELAFQRVEHGLDPLPDAAELPEPRRLVLAVGAEQMRAEVVGDEGLELSSGKPLSPMITCPGWMRCRSWSSMAWAASRSPILGFASPQITGIPSGVQTR